MTCRHLGAAATVVNGDVFLVRVTVEVVEIVLLAHVHAAHRSTRDETYLGQHLRGQPGLIQGLAQGQHAHQGGAGGDGILGNAQTFTHLGIGQLHLADGKLLVFRLQVLQLAHARAVVQQRL